MDVSNRCLFVIVILLLLSNGCTEGRNIKPAKQLNTSNGKSISPHDTIRSIPVKNANMATAPRPVEPKEGIKKTSVIIKIKKNLPDVNVRPEPSMKQPPIASLKGGDEVEKIVAKSKWTKIRFNRRNGELVIGWISNSTIEVWKDKIIRNQRTGASKPRKEDIPVTDGLSPM